MVFILAVELPDSQCDPKNAKRTAVVRMGRERACTLILAAAGMDNLAFALVGTPAAGILPAAASLPVLGVALAGWRGCDGSRAAARQTACD